MPVVEVEREKEANSKGVYNTIKTLYRNATGGGLANLETVHKSLSVNLSNAQINGNFSEELVVEI